MVILLSLSPAPWFPNEINHGYTENLMFLLAALMFADFLVFLVISRYYQYSHFSHHTTEATPAEGQGQVGPGTPSSEMGGQPIQDSSVLYY